MVKVSGPLTRCGGRWTEARFHSFIKSLLRSGTRRWAPIQDVKRKAKQARNEYKCANCGDIGPATIKVNGERVNNAIVDHINPIVDPEVGFVDWDSTIERMYCEEENLQLLCHKCHEEKTNEERATAKARREREKNNE